MRGKMISKKKKDKRRRLISGLTAMLMAVTTFGMVPQIAEPSHAAQGKDAIVMVEKGAAPNIDGGKGGSTQGGIYFGNYLQSSDGSGGFNNDPIKWRVLENKDGRLFLLSDQSLDDKRYNEQYTPITWEDCTLRSWLNNEASSNSFINKAFSQKERATILKTDLVNEDNSEYGTSGGENTTDKIFLLSESDVLNVDYGFTNNNTETTTRQAKNTDHTRSLGAYTMTNEPYVGNGYWWLRTPGNASDTAMYLPYTGSLSRSGSNVDNYNNGIAVRPAFNLDLNSVLFTSAVSGGKEAASSGLKEVGKNETDEWKLTLLDDGSDNAVGSGHENFSVESVTPDPMGVEVKYKKATTGDNEYISAIITDSAGKVKFYGRVKDCADQDDSEGTATISYLNSAIPVNVLKNGGSLYVFNEQYNGNREADCQTDYASKLIKIDPVLEYVVSKLNFSSDSNGRVDDWTFKGDANCDRKITAEDVERIYKIIEKTYPNPYEVSNPDKDTRRAARNADMDGNGSITPADYALLYKLYVGAASLSYEAFTFEVNDVLNDGCQIAAITVNGKLVDIPAKGQSAKSTINGVTYTVSIDAKGNGSVSGNYMEGVKVDFSHTETVKIRENDPNPTEEEFNKIITSRNTDGDLAGSTFGHLRARGVAKGKKKVQIRWTDPKLGAAKYVLYGNRCNTKGKKYTYVKMKEFNASTFRFTPASIHGQKLKKGTYYKFVVAAIDKNGKVVAISKTIHVATNGGKKGNDKSVKRVKPTKKAKYTLNVGKTKKLKVKAVKGKKKVAKHRAVAWESLNPEVATVSKGKVTARGKGTCTIYAYAQNGVYTTFTITVK